MPAPPIPTSQDAYRRAAASAISSSATVVAASGRASLCIAAPISARRAGAARSSVSLVSEVEVPLGDDDCCSTSLEPACVLRLVIRGRLRVRDEQRRAARRRDLPHRAAGPRDDDVGSGERRAEVVGERKQPVPGAPDEIRKIGVVALAGQVEHRGPLLAEGFDRCLVQPARPEASAADEDDGAVRRQVEAPPRLGGIDRHERASRDRPPDHPVLRALSTGDRIAEEDALRERHGQAVGEAEVCVRLGDRRRDAEAARGEHHGPGHVAPSPEDDVGPAPAQDAGGRGGRAGRDESSAERRHARGARQPAHAEAVELEAGGRNET